MLWNGTHQANQRQEVYQHRILTTEERMDIVLMSLIHCSFKRNVEEVGEEDMKREE